jgi:hypothetical protein
MAENLSLPAFPSFDIETDKANAGPLWGKWVERLEDLFIGLGIKDADITALCWRKGVRYLRR